MTEWIVAVGMTMTAVGLLALWRLARIDRHTGRAAAELEEHRRMAEEMRSKLPPPRGGGK